MTLLEIRADLSRVAKALERIADVLERHFPIPLPREPYTPEDVLIQSDEALWKREMETAESQEAGLPPPE